jgi:hypothetical protein
MNENFNSINKSVDALFENKNITDEQRAILVALEKAPKYSTFFTLLTAIGVFVFDTIVSILFNNPYLWLFFGVKFIGTVLIGYFQWKVTALQKDLKLENIIANHK